MAISLILPVHNAENFLIATLYSINEALGAGDQLVIIFDSCTDRSIAVFKEWRELNASSIEYEITTSVETLGGVAEARNRGLDLVDRPWISFIDHDDVISPSIYRDLLASAARADADVARCGFAKCSKEHVEICYPDLSPDYYAFFGIFIWNSLFDTRLIKANGIRFVPGYGEDYEFNLQVAQYCKRQTFVKGPLYFWKIHGLNHHMARRPEDFAERVIGIFNRNHSYLVNAPNAGAAFSKWVYEYITHLRGQFGSVAVDASIEKSGLSASLSQIKSLSRV
ncbi:glycosyltransferase family A protein [Rhizobium sp. CNPSo 3464]|uniref:glycosyltransferase family 2 protein n=1 Tax=Rhizobium sp. CNPSo 3464 TaxID=3021406 RepID=UPI00254D03FF|nr:glycosyltransferase family A protein [Rhizobium sp. CNPSo 3464]MDK4742752.1 glycosyltransferase family A protein [Rhizobium sp. CNPSo 3464]